MPDGMEARWGCGVGRGCVGKVEWGIGDVFV